MKTELYKMTKSQKDLSNIKTTKTKFSYSRIFCVNIYTHTYIYIYVHLYIYVRLLKKLSSYFTELTLSYSH